MLGFIFARFILPLLVFLVATLSLVVIDRKNIMKGLFISIFFYTFAFIFAKSTYDYIKEYNAFSDFAKNEINYSDISKIEVLEDTHSTIDYSEKKTIHTIEDAIFIREIVDSLKTISKYTGTRGGATSYILVMHKKDSSKIYFVVRYNSPTTIKRIKVYEDEKYIKYDHTSNGYKVSFPSKAKLFGAVNTETPPK